MSRPWFRMYSRFIIDPDVEELSFEDQRHFVFLLCMKCDGLLDKDFGDVEKRDRAIARRLGLQGEAFSFSKDRLMSSGLIDENWQPRSWNSLQFQSDFDASGAERQRRFRDKNNPSRVSNALRNGPVTLPEQIQNRTEQTKRPTKRPGRRVPDDFTPDLDFAVTAIPDVDAVAEAAKFKDWEFKTPRSDWQACWRTWVRNAKERQSYAKKSSGNGLEGVSWR